MITDIRKSSRCIWDSEEEAIKLFDRIKAYIPETWEGHKVIGLNERSVGVKGINSNMGIIIYVVLTTLPNYSTVLYKESHLMDI